MLGKNLGKICLANGQLKRNLFSQAKKQPKSNSQSAPAYQLSTLPSGISLTSLETDSPLARVAITVKAGSRYEPADQLGISHVIRSAAGLATEKYSAFGITRNIEYYGGRLTVIGSRDTITYLLEVHNDGDVLSRSFSILADTITKPAFKHWEISDNLERLKADCSLMEQNPFVQLTELIHKTAFRGGLRNSLYVPPFMIGKHTSEALKKYHEQTFVGSSVAVAGVGLSAQQLTQLVGTQLVLPGSAGPQEKSKYLGGEAHADSSSPLTYIAMACEGSSLNNIKDTMAAAIMQKVLGSGSQIKNAFDLSQVQRLGRAVSQQLSGKPTENIAVSAFNFNYENSGLFGFNLVAPSNADLMTLTKAVVKEFKAGCNSITDEEFNTAKNNLKTSMLIAMDDPAVLAHEMASQTLISNQNFTIEDCLKAIDSVTIGDCKNLGQRMLKSKPTLATIGQNAPYLEDIIAA